MAQEFVLNTLGKVELVGIHSTKNGWMQVFVEGETVGTRITMLWLAAHCQASKRWINGVEIKMKANIDMEHIKALFEDV